MSVHRSPHNSDRGETLIELVVAIAILGIAAVAILGGLMMSTQTSTIHRNSATGGAYVRSFAEAIQNFVDSSGGYKSCGAAAAAYAAVAVPDLPAGYVPSVTAVQSWNGSTWGACTGDGIQRLDLKVRTTGDSVRRAEETLTVVLRQPCNGSAAAAGADPCS
ncbi:prepilin-type N-terminal cleavage/methylation domain-containing protein [Nocardioides sp. MAH-18]|uniref:Prepilin-type N-terminal cleavage/methylation domain-containing protein n=1 Tax=Nocardioides agri TaxID=2682843 RepID=A0A6L6XWX3_9ACTN|nr:MULTISPECIES: type II secretion system protein [unclassified Nocardioides]MBA2952732.1 type II secretion system protein [Nocardioides sp. CGMCC 1.13656]MVQ51894.1 prepilin-type N-terminal cleavage/methylation domain-containing protein [Nocardioides sp. MAH-18]